MPKIINHNIRKKSILEIALNIFSKKGYNNTSLVNIAEESNISRPTLYKYFADKEQILFFSVKEFTDEFIKKYIGIATNKSLGIVERLENIANDILLSSLKKRQNIIRLSEFILGLEAQNNSVSHIVQRRVDPLRKILKDLFVEAGKRDIMNVRDINNTVDLFLSIIVSAIIQILLNSKISIDPYKNNIRYYLRLLEK